MNHEKLAFCVAEAEEFLRRAKPVMAIPESDFYSEPRLTGALRRQSLELTRALAALRRPER